MVKYSTTFQFQLEQPDFPTENQMSPRAPLQVLAYFLLNVKSYKKNSQNFLHFWYETKLKLALIEDYNHVQFGSPGSKTS